MGKEITQLTALTGANVADGDLFIVEDVSADETKKITKSELSAALGGGAVKTAEITMTDAQIKASPSAPFELFSALGADKGYLVIGGYVVSNIVANYTNQTNLKEIVIGYDNDNTDALVPLHNVPTGQSVGVLSASRLLPFLPATLSINTLAASLLTPQDVPIATAFNKNLALYVDNGADGNFTGGDPANYLKFVIVYIEATP